MLDSPFSSCGEAVESSTLVAIDPKASAVEAARLMKERMIGCLPVMVGDKLVGVISERDLVVKAIADGKDPKSCAVEDMMTPNPKTVEHDQPVRVALEMMNDHGFRHVPVMIEGRVMGVISARSLLAMA